jgi:hypothetical protein
MERETARVGTVDRRTFLDRARPAPPAPPPGPISRVARSLSLRAPSAALDPARMRILTAASIRRNVCPHYSLHSPRGPIPSSAPHLLKALMRNEANVARCRLRGGVHLEPDYVGDVCLSPRFNQCVFYEDGLSSG